MNNQSNKDKKPFGLQISIKIALQAMHDSVAPSSTILANLFYLQKERVFPKQLDTHFFSVLKAEPLPHEKKAISYILDEFKKPGINKTEILQSLLEADWVKKVSPPAPIQPQKPLKKKNPNLAKKNKPVAEPVVVIKTKKLI